MAIISSLAQQLRTHLILPDEVVIKEGCAGNSMYFIRRGVCRVIKNYQMENEAFICGTPPARRTTYLEHVVLCSVARAL